MQTAQAKVAYRIPLVGGTTDFPEFYRKHPTSSICCSIDKFLSVSVQRRGPDSLRIESMGALPWGIGLGSSGAFHSALISALARFRNQRLSKLAVAALAYQLETGMDNYATGRQDSVACLFRGVYKITYLPDDSVRVSTIRMSPAWRKTLSRRLLLFDTGVRRIARDSIRQIAAAKNVPLLSEISKLPDLLLQAWESHDLDFLATALDLQERYRSQLSSFCKSERTDEMLETARICGAGARLSGAGLGCLLCYCPEKRQRELRERLAIPEIQFSISW